MLRSIEKDTFAPYGIVLDFSCPADAERFEVILEEPASPWRLGMYRVRERECSQLECHPLSFETFEPVQGAGVLLVAPHDQPEQMEAFLLDRPVCLAKGVWHQMVTITPETIVKITENLKVESEFHALNRLVGIGQTERGGV